MFFSGNRSAINRETEEMYAEASALVEETGEIAAEKRRLKQKNLERSHRMKMTSNLQSMIKSSQAMKKQQRKAIESVEKFGKNNPMLRLKAMSQLPSDEELMEMDAMFGEERVGLLGEKGMAEVDIETSYLGDMAAVKGSQADLLSQFRKEVDPGARSDVMGLMGTIIGLA